MKRKNTMKTLVAYFSASRVTAKLAERLAAAINSPVYEIRPETPYSDADLDWTNKQSRSTLEMRDKSCRPGLADRNAPVAEAEVMCCFNTRQIKMIRQLMIIFKGGSI